MNMVVAFTVALVISAALLVGIYLAPMTEKKIRDEMGCLSIVGTVTAIVLALLIMFAPAVILGSANHGADSPVIDLDNCRYVGAEVYIADNDRAVFIDITSSDGALYAYNGQVEHLAHNRTVTGSNPLYPTTAHIGRFTSYFDMAIVLCFMAAWGCCRK